jgi:cell division protein FtsN
MGKKLLLISVLLLSLIVAGCSSKDTNKVDNPSNQEEATNNQETTEPTIDQESKDKINELESALENQDKKVNELENKINDLTSSLKEKEEVKEDKQTVTTSSNSSSKTNTKKLYRVISGSYSTITNANKQKEALKVKGFDAYVATYNKKYRVVVGAYSIPKNANIKKEMLAKAGFDSFVSSN